MPLPAPVRLHFQEKPWDLGAALAYTVVMTAVLVALGGNLLGILLVLFVPGYVLVAALFPRNGEIDWIERVALAFGLSIAVVPLLGLLLNFTPFGIRPIPVFATIATFTVAVGAAAYYRRMRVPAAERLSATVVLSMPAWKEYGMLDKVLTLALAASILVAAATLAYVVLTPRPGERFTEFYILGPSGNATGYPTNLTVSETGRVILGLVNHEGATVAYAVRVDLVGVAVVYNATSGQNETRELNRTVGWSWQNRSVADGATWETPFNFTISSPGYWKVQLLLYKDDVLTTQELHLYIRVT